ncbi:MAG: response regulator transcription factor [Burkholderiaceae bacterium]
MKLCLIEDDLLLGRALQASLEDARHQVVWVRLASDGLARLSEEAFDAALLDLGLPDDEGINLLRQLRRQANGVPVLIITARDSLAERIDGLEAGADDFLTKPFANVELLARLRAVMRRAQPVQAPDDAHLRAAGLCLDPDRLHVEQAGQQIALSPTEFALLASLVRNRNRIRTRRQLEDEAMPGSEGHSLDVHISNLRRKIGRDLIRTVRGVGYVVDDKEAA